MDIPIYQVAAFADAPFTGNPAAVCSLDRWLEDDVLQAIAAQINLSETAFVVSGPDGLHLRWFTPLAEVDLCGHATLATAFVLFSHRGHEGDSVEFRTLSGVVRVMRDGELLTLDFPSLPPQPWESEPGLAEALGATPREVLRSKQAALCVFDSQAEVAALRPDMRALSALECDRVMATAPGDDFDFVSRFFAPSLGVPEDPVTGSAHCSLTPYWAQRLGRNRLRARQISARGGNLLCELRGDRVLIGGRALLFLEGTIRV